MRLPPVSTLFPYTTLFRSVVLGARRDRQRRSEGKERPGRTGEERWLSLTFSAGPPTLGFVWPFLFSFTGKNCLKIGRAHVELQSPMYLVCRLLLEKKKKKS